MLAGLIKNRNKIYNLSGKENTQLKKGDRIEINDPDRGKFEAVFLYSLCNGKLIQFTIPNSDTGGLVGSQLVSKLDKTSII